MVLDLAVLVLALVALAGSCRALVAFARGRRARRLDHVSSPVAVVVTGDPEHPPASALVRSVAVSEAGSPTFLCAAHPLKDPRSASALREASSLMDPARVLVRAADPPPRVFPEAWLHALAAEAVPDDARVVVFLDPCARPAAREIAPVAAAVAGSEVLDAAGACPVAAPGTSGPLGSSLARLIADLAPLLVAWYGPAGLLPPCVALRRDALASALRDPLSVNRPGIAMAVLMSTPRHRAVLLPLSVGTLASGGSRSLRDALSGHLSVLARVSSGRTLLLGLGVAAFPVSLLTAAWSGSTASLAALALAALARALLAATWTRSVQGGGPALAALLLAPLRDLAGLGILAGALARRVVRSGGRLFQVRRGGILVPAGREAGEGGRGGPVRSRD